MLVVSIIQMETQAFNVVIADSTTHIPLPNASIYDKYGVAISMSNNKGALPKLSKNSYPITVRYLGFQEKTVKSECTDTIFLSENVSELQSFHSHSFTVVGFETNLLMVQQLPTSRLEL